MNRLVHVAALALMVAFPAFAETTNHLEVLKKSNWFATSGGFANATTSEGHAVAAICQETNAATTFGSLLRERGATEQLYGLLGLHLVNAPEFRGALPRFLESKEKVRVLVGCIAGEWEVREVARQIEKVQWNPRVAPVPGEKHAPGGAPVK